LKREGTTERFDPGVKGDGRRGRWSGSKSRGNAAKKKGNLKRHKTLLVLQARLELKAVEKKERGVFGGRIVPRESKKNSTTS